MRCTYLRLPHLEIIDARIKPHALKVVSSSGKRAIEVDPCSLVARLYLHLAHIGLVGKSCREARCEWREEKWVEQVWAVTPESRIVAVVGIAGRTRSSRRQCTHYRA